MQAYGSAFAKVYNHRWSGFARHAAPYLLDFYADTLIAQTNRAILDLCCGTGQVAVHFLEGGYQLVGIDLSEPMLEQARANAQPFVENGQARFVQADAAAFTLDFTEEFAGEKCFGLVVSTFDALNHLPDLAALRACFACVAAVTEGYFIFDLNTRVGLRRWNSIEIDDSREDMTIVNHGIYDVTSERAWMKVTGFVRNADGLYERFEQTAYNTVFAMQDVKTALEETGWQEIYFALLQDLKTPLADPEEHGRVFIVAKIGSRDLSGAFSGIERTLGVDGGEPCIARTRIPVWVMVQARKLGSSEADILRAYPSLHAEDLANAWAYYTAHQEEIESQILDNELA